MRRPNTPRPNTMSSPVDPHNDGVGMNEAGRGVPRPYAGLLAWTM